MTGRIKIKLKYHTTYIERQHIDTQTQKAVKDKVFKKII